MTAPAPRRVGPWAVVAPPDPTTAVRAVVSISPFSYPAFDAIVAEIERSARPTAEVEAALRAHVGRDYALANSGRHALDLILRELALAPDDVVTIVTTSGLAYVSGCVTGTIERHCRWSMQREARTRAFLAIHEWGRACETARDLVKLGLPVIEDCAYAFATRFADGTPVGSVGDFALFSLTKMFTVSYGGLAVGLRSAPAMSLAHREFLLACLGPELSDLQAVCDARRAVWRALAERFTRAGAPPYFDAVPGESPSVYMFAVDPSRVALDAVKRRYQAHGVESSIFYGADAVYIPAHHRVGAATRELMARLFEDAVATEGRETSTQRHAC